MASSPSSEGVETVDVGAAKGLVGSGHLYLDVRTIGEFNKGHPENALNVPYMFFTPQGRETNPQFLEQVSSICSKDDFIVVGFKNVKNMGGGYAAWVDSGFAVKKPQQEL